MTGSYMTDNTSMLEETATVIEVMGDRLVAETESRSSCSHCSTDSCSTSVVAKLFGIRRNRLVMENSLHAKAGDRVVIGIPDTLLVRASVMAYLLPLVVMLGVTACGDALGMNEIGLSLLAIAGLAMGFFVVRWAIRRGSSQRFQPRLLRIVAPGWQRVGIPTYTYEELNK
jgi:sigma-E factor negative regulatory protein RseC